MTAAAALERLKIEMARCPYHAFLKPEAVSADAATGAVVVRLAYRPEFRLAYDSELFHGGIVSALIDITGHAAVAVQTGRVSPTIDLRIDFLKAARGGALLASAKPLKVGRAIARADVEIRDEEGQLVAVGRGAFSTSSGG